MMKTENYEHMKELVLRAKEQDNAAWEELYQETVRQTYFVVRKIVSDSQEAEDLVQETYLAAYSNLHRLQAPETFRAWLSMIAANKCRDYLKKHKSMVFTDLQNEDGEDMEWEDEDRSWQPEEVLDEKETTRLVAEIIGALPEDQKLCVLLYYREELSVGQIAESLGVSSGTVKSRLNYARAKVKDQVLALEKKGTKLYGVAPLPFLAWLLKAEMAAMDIPAGLTASAVTATATASTVTAATATTATASTTAATAGTAGAAAVTSGAAAEAAVVAPIATAAVKTGLFSSLGAKVAAGVLAGVVGISGTAGVVAAVIRDKEKSVAEDSFVEENIADDEEIKRKVEVPEEIAAAYEAVLASGITEHGTKVTHYAYIDLGWDGVPELVVADGAGSKETTTNAELFCYIDGEAVFCGKTLSQNDYLYIANEEHLLARHPSGNQLLNKDEFVSYREFIVAAFDDGSFAVFADAPGANVGYATENYNDYNAMPGEYAKIPKIKTARVIEMLENETSAKLLRDIIDFDKAWCWRKEYSEGSAHSELVYTFAFKDDGTMVYTVAIKDSEVLCSYYGTYTEAGGCITIEVDYRNGETGKGIYKVTETADGFDLTVISDESLVGDFEKGEVLHYTEEPDNDAERHWWFAEVMSKPDYEEWN